jgi:peptidyl-prolyl cis-trans isomerase SurA
MVSKRFEEHVADFSKDFTKIKELALKDKQLKTVKKWLRFKIDETFVNVNKSFRECSFSNNWIKK